MCGIINFFLIEEFQCLDVDKLKHFYSYLYLDKFLSINQINFFFLSGNSIKVGYLADMSREKNFNQVIKASPNQKQKFVIIIVLIFVENDGAKQ